MLPAELHKFHVHKFHPSRGTQDKRDRDALIDKCQSAVSHGLYRKSIPVFTMCPEVDSKRRFISNVVCFPPGTPLEQFYIDHKESMDRAVKESLMMIVQAEQALKKDKIEKVKDIFGVGEEFDDDDENSQDDETESCPITKPTKPIFAMVQEEAVLYYPTFLRDLYQIESKKNEEDNPTKPKLWPKRILMVKL